MDLGLSKSKVLDLGWSVRFMLCELMLKKWLQQLPTSSTIKISKIWKQYCDAIFFIDIKITYYWHHFNQIFKKFSRGYLLRQGWSYILLWKRRSWREVSRSCPKYRYSSKNHALLVIFYTRTSLRFFNILSDSNYSWLINCLFKSNNV